MIQLESKDRDTSSVRVARKSSNSRPREGANSIQPEDVIDGYHSNSRLRDGGEQSVVAYTARVFFATTHAPVRGELYKVNHALVAQLATTHVPPWNE